MTASIDLNADVGEECGDDAGLFGIITTANVASGGHAGGGEVLVETVRQAKAAAVAVGAHPSYPDRVGFGRVSRAHEHDAAGITEFVRWQVVSVGTACREHAVMLSHVKAHGALYHDAATDVRIAEAFVEGVIRGSSDLGLSDLAVMGLPSGILRSACEGRGLPYVAEAFADRAYAPDGTLLPRSQAGAVISDRQVAARQALQVAMDGTVTAVDGTRVRLHARTVCLHGDSPGAVAMARTVREMLEGSGIRIAPFGGRA